MVWCAGICAVLAGVIALAAGVIDTGAANVAVPVNDDYLVKQVVWKKCHRKLTPACLKLSLVRTVEMMSKDSSFALLPGVSFSTNSSLTASLPPDLARSLSQDQPPIDDLVNFSMGRYIRSLTLNVNLVDFFSGGNETLQDSVIDVFSGRAKGGGLGGYGAIAAVMGGSIASMMLAALAALAGKALMTSMAALMMSAMAAMKGGGGGGGGEHKTYEVITKPIVSHINTHSSEVQHEHHGHYHKRSLDRGEVEEGKWGMEPYLVYSAYQEEVQRDKKSLEPKKEYEILEEHSNSGTDPDVEPPVKEVVEVVDDNVSEKEKPLDENNDFPIELSRSKRSTVNEKEINEFKNIVSSNQRRIHRSTLNEREFVPGSFNYIMAPINPQEHPRRIRSTSELIKNKNGNGINEYFRYVIKKDDQQERYNRGLNHNHEDQIHILGDGDTHNDDPIKYKLHDTNYGRIKRNVYLPNQDDSTIYHFHIGPENQHGRFGQSFIGNPQRNSRILKRFAVNEMGTSPLLVRQF